MKCLVGTHADVTAAISVINTTCGLPSEGTTTWDIAKQGYLLDFWFIKSPPSIGWGRFTRSQMMQGLVTVFEQESSSNWWPPIEPPGLTETSEGNP